MNRKNCWITTLVFTALAAPALIAQQPDTTKKPTVLDAAIITATRVSQAVREVPANVAVLGSTEIQRTAART